MKIRIESKDLDVKDLLCIGLQDDESCFCTISPTLTLDVAMRLLHTLSLHILQAYTISANGGTLPDTPTEEQTNKLIAIKSQIYDMYNEAASSVLELYAPEFELRPDVTTEAIKKAEADVIKKRYKHLSPEDKRQANANLHKLKKQLLKDKAASKSKAKTAEEIIREAEQVS